MDTIHSEVKKTEFMPSLSLFSIKLIELLAEGKPGAVLTDESMSEHCGKDTRVTGDGYCYLGTAIKHVLRNKGIVWQRAKGAGCIKCLDPTEIRNESSAVRKRVSRLSKRSMRQLGTVALDELEDVEKREHLTCMAHMGTMVQFSDSHTAKKLAARNVSEPQDMRKLLEAFSG